MPRVRQTFGFAAVPLFGMLTPLLVLPAITTHSGAEGWAAIAVGQAIGSAIAAFVELGWSWNGPMRVARAKPSRRRHYAALAVNSRLVLLLPLGVIATAAAFLLGGAFALESALTALASCFAGLSMAWYFFGIGRPWLTVALDSIPRLTGAGVSAIMLFAGLPLWTYPLVALLVPWCIAVTLSLKVAGVTLDDFRRARGRSLRFSVRAQASIAAARGTSALYMQLPVVIVSAVSNVGATAVFAAGDRLTRMVLTAMSPLPNAVQQWVGSPPTLREREVRARRAMIPMDSSMSVKQRVGSCGSFPGHGRSGGRGIA
ncbi:hypothetical protein BCL67_1152 [Nesterenkonia sandarakina]|uniref:Polysaccharide biosynthesis protein n=1 Tax=Nesterenkonia sandarakina TaxID=272918 RepID=A0A2T0YEU0_9MICC|nr:hypothetical protein BCL67_1152 [Nesterenkonia sandarakina]